MSSRERRNSENIALRESISELEIAGRDYADFMLMDSTVHVDMQNISSTYSPPLYIEEILGNADRSAPVAIKAMNLDLEYDRSQEQFSIVRGGLSFATGHDIRIDAPRSVEDDSQLWHDMTLMKRQGEQLVPQRHLGLAARGQVQHLFQLGGVNIPMAPLRSPYEKLSQTLLAAEQRTVTASKTIPISGPAELVIAERIVEITPAADQPGDESKLEVERNHEISLQVVDYSSVATKAIEAVLLSESPTVAPYYSGLYIHSGKRNLTAEADKQDANWLESQFTPIESQLLPPSIEHIDFILRALRSAGI